MTPQIDKTSYVEARLDFGAIAAPAPWLKANCGHNVRHGEKFHFDRLTGNSMCHRCFDPSEAADDVKPDVIGGE